MEFSADNKASRVKFCAVVHQHLGQRIAHFGDLCSPESQNRTNQPMREERRKFRCSWWLHGMPIKFTWRVGIGSTCVDIRQSPKTDVLVIKYSADVYYRISSNRSRVSNTSRGSDFICSNRSRVSNTSRVSNRSRGGLNDEYHRTNCASPRSTGALHHLCVLQNGGMAYRVFRFAEFAVINIKPRILVF